jgi:hypothetical protein
MSLDTRAILTKLAGIGKASGLFVKVDKFEPRGQPGNGVTLFLISGPMRAITSSGLNNASLRWQIDGRLYTPMNYEPASELDAVLTAAASKYLEALCAQFTLGGLVRCIDVFGSDGEPLSATPGYLGQNDKVYRVVTLEIPLLINQQWTLTG